MSGDFAVSVAVTGLWTGPDAPRVGDALMLADPPRFARWLRTQGAAERRGLWGRLDSQLLLGERVVVHEVRDGWARVNAPQQPSARDPAGYPGFVRMSHLVPEGGATGSPVVVTVPTTAILSTPDGPALMPEVGFATVLPAVDRIPDWVEVRLPDGRTGWLPGRDVAPHLAEPGLPTATGLVAAGRQFLGQTYLAGGVHGLSYDCSGLVHALYRRFGYTVPRDACDQAGVGVPVPMDEARFGDLLLFTNPETGDLYHVAICLGMPHALHCSQTDWACIDTPLTRRRRDHLSHVRRFCVT